MSLKDDLDSGESYYIVEIKAIKRIMEAAADLNVNNTHIICFVDEVLRGTNTTERIAASSQILKSFADKGVLCFDWDVFWVELCLNKVKALDELLSLCE